MHTVKWLVAAGLLVTLGFLAAVSVQSTAAAAEGGNDRSFSTHSIKGSYGFSTNGFGMVLPPSVPVPIPAADLGRIVFDGAGGCSISLTVNFNGQSLNAQSATCTYTVNADGTGTNSATFPGTPLGGDPIPIVFVIVDEGREIRLLTTGSIVSTLTARRQ
jgi:hypothetical protein